MNNVLEMFQGVDLSPHVQGLLQLVETADPILPALVLAILTLLGARMAAPYPLLRSWGLRLAGAVFVVYLVATGFAHGGFDTARLPQTALRALVAAGLVLAPLWIVAPLVLFLFSRIRLALAAFLLYLGYAWWTTENFVGDSLTALSFQAGIASALTLLVAWILQPITDFVWARVRNSFPQRDRAAQPPTADSSGRPESVRRDTPPRPAEGPLAAEQRRRRQRARMRLELCYARHEPLIAAAFPRSVFEGFLNRYLGDHLEAEDVEEYAHELEVIIYQHVNNPQPLPTPPATLNDLSDWFRDERPPVAPEPDVKRKRTRLAGPSRRTTHLAGPGSEHEESE